VYGFLQFVKLFESLQAEIPKRSVGWIVGTTSVAFEMVVLALAAWQFCRRDY
jgi:hypothetical protein